MAFEFSILQSIKHAAYACITEDDEIMHELCEIRNKVACFLVIIP